MTRGETLAGLEFFVVGLPGALRNQDLLPEIVRSGVLEGAIASRDLREATTESLQPFVDTQGAHRAIGRDLTAGEVGCALSHRDHWELAWQRGSEWALVLEDDAIPRANFPEAVRLTMTLPSSTPTVVALHDTPQGGRRTPVVRHPVRTGDGVDFHLCLHNTGGTVGYLVNRAALAVLRSGHTRLICPADWPAAAGRIAFLVALPYPVGTMDEAHDSVIGSRNPSSAPRTAASTRAWHTYIGRYWALKGSFSDYCAYFRWSYGSGRGFLKHSARLGLVREGLVPVADRGPRQSVVSRPLETLPCLRRQYRDLLAHGGGR